MEEMYAGVFMDAVHLYVRSEGQIVKKAVYVAVGVEMDGARDMLGIFNGLKNRGVADILITCVDGLTGFTSAIEIAFQKAEIKQRDIH